MVQALYGFFFTPVAPARPYLLTRGLLFLLSFDCWLGLVPRGAYYVSGFNVAHFAWLDAIQPAPSPALYVTLVLGAGLLALSMALSRPSRLGLAVLLVAYTYAWLMSMLDSYQHHYLLSLLLFALIFAPHRTATEVFGPPGAQPNRRRPGRLLEGAARRDHPAPAAWAHVLFGLSCAIVYLFTAVTKLSPAWRAGNPLRALAGADFFPQWERGWLGAGGSASQFWAILGAGAIAAQIVTCLGYVLATQRDRLRGRWTRVALTLAMFAPLGFHLGTEGLSLGIGWFSYYMIWIALVFFLPAPTLEALGRTLTAPSRWAAARWQRRSAGLGDRRLPTIALAVLGAAGLAGLGLIVDLPGALAAGEVAGGGILLVTVTAVRQRRFEAARVAILSVALAELLCWASIAGSDARFDYYRTAAGAHRRLGRWEAALEAYVKANRYAPPGEDRKDREAEARRQVESLRAPAPTPAR